jgi:type I restriction enzyme S subunit
MVGMMEIQEGFKQTAVGDIPSDWEVTKLKSIVSKLVDNRGKTPPYSKNEVIELIETVSISFVNQHPDYSKVTKYVSKYTFENWFRDHPKKEDILVSTVGEYSGSTALMNETRGTVAQNLIAVRVKNVVSAYIFHWTRSSCYKKQLDQVMMSHAQPSLRVPWLLNFQIPLSPTKAEQTAIATALNDADALITQLEKLIAKKRAIKQGAMQELLKPKDGWELKKLGEILKVRHGKSQKEVAADNGVFPILASGGVIGRAKTFLYDKPSVLIGRKGTIDEPQYMDTPFWSVDTLFYTEINREYDPKFIFYMFNLIDWYSYNEASGVPSLNAKTIELIEKQFPKFEEQTRIAQILSDMDVEIEALEKKLEKYKMIKQGMMQNLLTGKIRLI